MNKQLLSCILLTSCCQAFDKAELLFERQDYLGAVTAFLKSTKISDARVFPFLQHCQDNKLVDPNALDDNTKKAWFDRLAHAQFTPTGYPGGNIFLQLSLLASDLKENGQQIMSLSRTYQTGYGFYILARAQEQESGNKPSNSAVKKIIANYQQGASYADPYSLLALSRFRNKVKIEKRYVDELEFLQQNGISSEHRETGLPEVTLSRLYTNGSTTKIKGDKQTLTFPADAIRKALWQFVAAQKGNVDMQLMFSEYADRIKKDYPNIPAPTIQQGIRWSYLAALSGNFPSQNKVGEAFHPAIESGLFTADGTKSVYWFLEALESFKSVSKSNPNYHLYEQEHAQCLVNIGLLYDKGLGGVGVDEAKALGYYKQAAELYNNPVALYNIASMTDHGRGAPKDTLAAKKYFEQSSNAGLQEASLLLANRYLEGTFEHYPQNQVLAYGYLKRCQMHPEAKYLLAGLLHHLHPKITEFIIKKDEAEAEKLLKQSAVDGYHDAQEFWVNHNFNNRNSLSQDDQLLLVRLAQNLYSLDPDNFAEVFCILMMENYQGKFDNHDQKIHDLLVTLESKGSQIAYLNIANAYENGMYGFEQSLEKAIEYYRKSPNTPQALSNLGFCLERTKGIAAIDEILEVYKKSFELGCSVAGNNLGALYQNGKLVTKDAALAREYYKKAALQGDSDATVQYLQYILSKDVNDEALKEAKQLISSLDHKDPFSLYVISVVYFKLGSPDLAVTFLTTSASAGLPQAMYTLGMYMFTLSCSISDPSKKRDMRDKSIAFISSAAEKNLELARSALRILKRTNRLDEETSIIISNSLLAGDREKARLALERARQEQESQSESSSSTTIREENRDQKHTRRIEAELESFLDPNNHITINDFQRIVGHLGGSIRNGKGSAIRADLNGLTTGVHRMHRPGQSSNVELEPGRASSLREFIRHATDNN